MALRGLRHGPELPGTAGLPRGTSRTSWRRVSRESWSTPQALEHGRVMPVNDVRHREPSDQGPSCPGKLVDTTGPHSRFKSPGTAGRHCRPLDTGPSRPGQLVDTEGTRPRARVAWDSWSTLQALGHMPDFPGTPGRPLRHLVPWRKSPGTASQHCGPSEQSAIRPGQLFDTASPRTRARVTRGIRSTLRALKQGPEMP